MPSVEDPRRSFNTGFVERLQFDGTSTGQTETLQAFQRNFVQPHSEVPPAAGTIYRQMVSQPGVYWLLSAPFVDIVGLYSNIGESQGAIAGGAAGQAQKVWLQQTLAEIKSKRDAQNAARKALIIAVHHPPFSSGGHGPSAPMLQDIDDACHAGMIQPDAVLAGHSHDYQRYTRFVPFNGKELQIPFIVAGGGGRGLSPHIVDAHGQRDGDHTYDKSLLDYGYLKVTVDAHQLVITSNQVASSGQSTKFDGVRVDLASNKLR